MQAELRGHPEGNHRKSYQLEFVRTRKASIGFYERAGLVLLNAGKQ